MNKSKISEYNYYHIGIFIAPLILILIWHTLHSAYPTNFFMGFPEADPFINSVLIIKLFKTNGLLFGIKNLFFPINSEATSIGNYLPIPFVLFGGGRFHLIKATMIFALASGLYYYIYLIAKKQLSKSSLFLFMFFIGNLAVFWKFSQCYSPELIFNLAVVAILYHFLESDALRNSKQVKFVFFWTCIALLTLPGKSFAYLTLLFAYFLKKSVKQGVISGTDLLYVFAHFTINFVILMLLMAAETNPNFWLYLLLAASNLFITIYLAQKDKKVDSSTKTFRFSACLCTTVFISWYSTRINPENFNHLFININRYVSYSYLFGDLARTIVSFSFVILLVMILAIFDLKQFKLMLKENKDLFFQFIPLVVVGPFGALILCDDFRALFNTGTLMLFVFTGLVALNSKFPKLRARKYLLAHALILEIVLNTACLLRVETHFLLNIENIMYPRRVELLKPSNYIQKVREDFIHFLASMETSFKKNDGTLNCIYVPGLAYNDLIIEPPALSLTAIRMGKPFAFSYINNFSTIKTNYQQFHYSETKQLLDAVPGGCVIVGPLKQIEIESQNPYFYYNKAIQIVTYAWNTKTLKTLGLEYLTTFQYLKESTKEPLEFLILKRD